jgi:hypothetical protein
MYCFMSRSRMFHLHEDVRASVFPGSSERPPHLDTQGDMWRIYSNRDPYGLKLERSEDTSLEILMIIYCFRPAQEYFTL